MNTRIFSRLAIGLLSLCGAGLLIADEPRMSSDLTVHEWGTFTSIAGASGNAIEWNPLNGPTDLPEFVEHLSAANFKIGLRGTIRMETPVLYFYSPRDTTVSVEAQFSKGVITEWYPHADHVAPVGIVRDPHLSQLRSDGSIKWSAVVVSPNLNGNFAREARPDRYYTARETSSTPLRVNTAAGDEQEKFLFYRGVSAAPLPLSAQLNADGGLMIKSFDENEIPAMILFERRGQHVGYRIVRAPADETTLDPPELNGDIDSLRRDLETILVDRGLYADEAHAMVETWRNSWFEEGTRLIYIVPRTFIDRIVPLTISPVPAQIVRVFVGRLEIVTPATADAVTAAKASGDERTLARYRRFLEPILQIAKERHVESTSRTEDSR